jgi:integrase
MPRRAAAPRLWIRPARRDATGRVTHQPAYFILDRGQQISTGCSPEDIKGAEAALAEYIVKKHKPAVGSLDPSQIPVTDVLATYVVDVVPKHSRPDETKRRIARVAKFFGEKMLSEVNGPSCRAYAKQATTDAMARRDLEELRSAINHHRAEGLHDRIVSVVLPDRRPPRERWLDRKEAALLLWTAWRRRKCQHIAKFTLVALYTGRRAAVVCGASFRREAGRPFVDLANGMLWPPERAKVTNKRNPPIPLPGRLLIHLRAWHRSGQRYVVEWGGHPVTRLDKSLKMIAIDAGLGDQVTPHVLRHTAATWQMQAGTDVLEAGRFLGMTVRTLEGTYAHHRPEHLVGARDAYQRHRQRLAAGG